MAAAVPRTASRPSRTARTDNGPDLTVKARSQPGPTRSTEPDYLRAGIHAEEQPSAFPNRQLAEESTTGIHSRELTHRDCAAIDAGSRHVLRADRPLQVNETEMRLEALLFAQG